MRALVVGCGYVGLPLAAELARRGHEVFGVRRSSEGAEKLSAAGVQPLFADVTDAASLRALPNDFDWVVNAVSSSKGGADVYRAVYLEGTRHLLAWLDASRVRRYVHLSSTSVYAQTDGSVVTETSATEPTTETGKILVETEAMLRAAAELNFPAIILRVAGIYGPERGHLFQQFLRGEARLAGDGSRWLNMIHRDDVVGAVIAALERGATGQTYNVADDEPVTQRDFFGWLAHELNRPLPPVASEAEPTARKRGLTNKRVDNRRLREDLGYTLKLRRFRAGYSAEINRLRLRR